MELDKSHSEIGQQKKFAKRGAVSIRSGPPSDNLRCNVIIELVVDSTSKGRV